jgi:hypothetical protein
MQIELGSWAKKDVRKLAADVGMERFYRLVFSPTSSDVHGSASSSRIFFTASSRCIASTDFRPSWSLRHT